MKFAHVILSNLLRKPVRTLFTALSIAIAFLLFGLLAAIRNGFAGGVEMAGADRLMTTHKVSITQLLPQRYQEEIEPIPGVKAVAHATWFGGIYRNPTNFFAQLAVAPEDYLGLRPELVLPPEQKQSWLDDRTGAVAGRTLAEKFGWQLGDRIPIRPTIWQRHDGAEAWEFTLRGIFEGSEPGVDTNLFLFRFDYFDEARADAQGYVGWFYELIDDSEQAAEIAKEIDLRFANSEFETGTVTEAAFARSFANQIGNVGAIVTAILGIVFFTILVVVANTMAQAVRERTHELGIFKSLGLTNGQTSTLVLAESFALSFAGGLLGLGLAVLLVGEGDLTQGALASFYLRTADLVVGLILVALLGLVSGILPAWQAMRLSTIEALRRT
ncbi:MAG: FtsX-like permease family protein [bacterium]|nr:FtsX-like permease family protein [bacterium]